MFVSDAFRIKKRLVTALITEQRRAWGWFLMNVSKDAHCCPRLSGPGDGFTRGLRHWRVAVVCSGDGSRLDGEQGGAAGEFEAMALLKGMTLVAAQKLSFRYDSDWKFVTSDKNKRLTPCQCQAQSRSLRPGKIAPRAPVGS